MLDGCAPCVLSTLWLCLASWVAGALLFLLNTPHLAVEFLHNATVPKLYRGLQAIIVDYSQWKVGGSLSVV